MYGDFKMLHLQYTDHWSEYRPSVCIRPFCLHGLSSRICGLCWSVFLQILTGGPLKISIKKKTTACRKHACRRKNMILVLLLWILNTKLYTKKYMFSDLCHIVTGATCDRRVVTDAKKWQKKCHILVSVTVTGAHLWHRSRVDFILWYFGGVILPWSFRWWGC